MSGLVAGIAASAIAKRATSVLSVVPRPVWEALAVIGYVVALIALHQHYAHAAIAVAKAEQKALDQKALDQTVANYRAAAAQAKADDAANKARVEAAQAKINQERDASYEARIADARARADSLRAQLAAAAHTGSPAVAPVPGVPAAASGPLEASGEDGLSDALTATEQAIQLDELIKWVRQQHSIDPNKEPSK